MAKKPEKPQANRPSLQLLVDRAKVARFRALCIEQGRTMSEVVDLWIDASLASRKLPTPPKG